MSKAKPKGKKDWMEKIKDKHPGECTGPNLGSKECAPGTPQYALAKTYKKAAAKRKGK